MSSCIPGSKGTPAVAGPSALDAIIALAGMGHLGSNTTQAPSSGPSPTLTLLWVPSPPTTNGEAVLDLVLPVSIAGGAEYLVHDAICLHLN